MGIDVNATFSRRGSTTSSDIDIMLLHPSHVHIPTPNIKQPPPPKSSGATNDKLAAPLVSEVLEPLKRIGIIADTLSMGPKKWQGVVRVPERDSEGVWETQNARLEGIESMTSSFRRADLK